MTNPFTAAETRSFKGMDPQAVADLARQRGYKVQVMYPGMYGTCDYDPSRFRVWVGEDGTVDRAFPG